MRDLIVTENITLDGVIEATRAGSTRPAPTPRSIRQTLRRQFASSARPPMRCCSGG
jgi:hypothetical protein